MLKQKKVFQISNTLREGLGDTIKAAENYGGQLRVEAVPLRKIELDPDNPRELILTLDDLPEGPEKNDPLYEKKNEEKKSLESIAASIQSEGVINPVLVYKHGDKYRVVAGERRTLASKLAGKLDIPAKILNEKPTELKLSILQWIENIERADLTLWERLRNLEKIVLNYRGDAVNKTQLTATEISKLIGCSLSHAMNYLLVLYAEDEVRIAIQNNKLRNLEKAALISKIEIKEARLAALQACINGVSMQELKSIVDTYKKTNNENNLLNIEKKAGRQSKMINLGNTRNTEVVKLLVESILSHSKYKHLENHFEKLNWKDLSVVSKAFNRLIKVLEEHVN